MATRLCVFALVALLSFMVLADPLLAVLRREGFTEFAQQLEGPDGEAVRNACSNMIIYTPTNAALTQPGAWWRAPPRRN